MLRHKTWHELNMVLRAGSKAIVIPYTLLHVSRTYFSMPAPAAAFLAFSYLLPWVWENGSSLYDLEVSPARTHRQTQRAQGSGAGRAGPNQQTQVQLNDDVECGADRSRDAIDVEVVEASAALKAILENVPERVFLGTGEVCPICIEAFDTQATEVATSLRSADASRALRGLTPPVIALRCGHALHIGCANMAVANAGNRHVRCPLCREPATLVGATSARLFT